jgi:hypothetical protein
MEMWQRIEARVQRTIGKDYVAERELRRSSAIARMFTVWNFLPLQIVVWALFFGVSVIATEVWTGQKLSTFGLFIVYCISAPAAFLLICWHRLMYHLWLNAPLFWALLNHTRRLIDDEFPLPPPPSSNNNNNASETTAVDEKSSYSEVGITAGGDRTDAYKRRVNLQWQRIASLLERYANLDRILLGNDLACGESLFDENRERLRMMGYRMDIWIVPDWRGALIVAKSHPNSDCVLF